VKVVALAGGVGGAKLADGLARCLDSEELTIVVNTGDDFEHYGLQISPDLDTVCYTLAGLANDLTGWGRRDETWQVFANLERLGGPAWFHLGDQDFATHLERTRRLHNGESLSQITVDFCARWGIKPCVLPMSDDCVPTFVDTLENGRLPFQEYFVQFGCQPTVTGFEFVNAAGSRPAPGVVKAIQDADCVVVCPSNPMVSIGPILAIPDIWSALSKKTCVVAVSPIIGGKAVKGPAAKMYAEMGVVPSALEVARQYQKWVQGIVIDREDAHLNEPIERLGYQVKIENTLMLSKKDREDLAKKVLELASCIIVAGGQ
jgi:LPPG:FO 2-phospho-L-lactate transferase